MSQWYIHAMEFMLKSICNVACKGFVQHSAIPSSRAKLCNIVKCAEQ